MAIYNVVIPYVAWEIFRVEAKSAEEAKQLVMQGEIEPYADEPEEYHYWDISVEEL